MELQVPGFVDKSINEEAFPGSPLVLGDSGPAVLNTKNALNAISVNFPSIPKISPITPTFDESMEIAVKQFQHIFNLPVTGIIDKITWYEIRKVFSAVKKLAQTTADNSLAAEILPNLGNGNESLEVIPKVQLVQYFLNVFSAYHSSIPAVDINGMLNTMTINSITEFQKTFNIPATGEIDCETWNNMYYSMQGILNTLPPTAISLPALLYPGETYSEGSEGSEVYIMQQYLEFISNAIPDIPSIDPTGIFDYITTESVIAFQTLYGITPTGIIEQQTWNKIVDVYRQLRFSDNRPTSQFTDTVLEQTE
ncbi:MULTISPECIES: peptidoglycan-binding domain-containing protein [unclassified Sedimentibacter]|uniref:peptidoglycan-binding domain-containing protein n=1 Tax=unclassified Sedimentibacter TaxID=2649220 RepID=UPI0027E1F081|nr:peptidoglycan-binding domain-containing protein [Sedimentibacter sp. MB35-C1]WMJ76705.1 peptidoglycan-binding domain-containing protein [Sedimentibacter sp. MB35-C1]